MAPTKSTKGKEVLRTNISAQGKASTTSKPGKRSTIKHQRDASSLLEGGGLPGVQKIKSALRQTRRLLAKESLAVDIRVVTERRLKSLEDELASAELARKERNMATKYHKVKFFERKKVIRKMNQVKRSLATAEDMRKSARKKLERELLERRVDLNYTLHFPKTCRYISLFPPEVRKGDQNTQDPETSRRREEIRSEIRSAMLKGTMCMEPELEAEHTNAKPKPLVALQSKLARDTKVGNVSSYVNHGIEGDVFFKTKEDNHNGQNKPAVASDDSSSDGAMSE